MTEPNSSHCDQPHPYDPEKRIPLVAFCKRCSRKLPLTTEYWQLDATKKLGFCKPCKECRSKYERDTDTGAMMIAGYTVEEAEEKLNAMNRKFCEFILKVPEDPWKGTLDGAEEVYHQILRYAGGPDGIAKMLMAQYIASKPGSMVRQKVLNEIIALSKKVTEMHLTETPLDKMSDDELQAKLKQLSGQWDQRNAPKPFEVSGRVVENEATRDAEGGADEDPDE